VLGGDTQCDGAAEAVADQVRLLDAEAVHQPHGLVGPGLHAEVDVFGPLGEPEADHVRATTWKSSPSFGMTSRQFAYAVTPARNRG
jgi:hypothetical protein